MTGYETPEHLVRMQWHPTRLISICILDGCDWESAIGYPDRRAPLDEQTRRQLYRQAAQAAAMHGWPEMDWQPGDSIIARTCDCPPDPTATPSFWARIRGAVL